MTQTSSEASHPVEVLFRSIKGFRYPTGVVGTWSLVEGPEFFPGGCGLWNARAGKPWPPLSPGCVVVLGHNLDSIDSYRRNLKTGGIMRGPTWSNLKKLLVATGIGFEEVFLTNFFMGVGPDQLGEFPGAADGTFVSDCLKLLADTIRLLKPRALVVLGGHTRRHLANLSDRLRPWGDVSSFDEMDGSGYALVQHVSVRDAPEFSAVNIVHPSGALMGNNQGKRRYRGFKGFDAEVALVSDAVGRNLQSPAQPKPAAEDKGMSSGVTVPQRPVTVEHPSVGRRTSRLQAVSHPTTWRVNTDINARKDRRTCDLWYQHGMAIAGDFAGHEMKHAGVFRKLSKGDHIFMHHSGLGVVGFGEVLEDWDGAVYSGDDRVLYVEEIYEYRIRVAWDKGCDCRNRPVPISGRLPHTGTYSEVNPDKWDIVEVVRQLAQATHPQSAK